MLRAENTSRKRPGLPRPDYVYFIQAGPDGPIKIGHSTDVESRRLPELQTANPAELRVLFRFKCEGTVDALAWEERLHALFADLRISQSREWFRSHADITDLISAMREIETTLAGQPIVVDCEIHRARAGGIRIEPRRRIGPEQIGTMVIVGDVPPEIGADRLRGFLQPLLALTRKHNAALFVDCRRSPIDVHARSQAGTVCVECGGRIGAFEEDTLLVRGHEPLGGIQPTIKVRTCARETDAPFEGM